MKKNTYNPRKILVQELIPSCMSRDRQGNATIDDKDIIQLMEFYRNSVKPGTLLSLGSGTTAIHYLGALEDKLTHITALDMSKKNLKLLEELFNPEQKAKYVNPNNRRTLGIVLEASEQYFRQGKRNASEILNSIKEKTTIDGKLDFAAQDMNYLDLKDKNGQTRQYDNIHIGFALFHNSENEVVPFLQKARKHLAPGGRIVIADFYGFDEKDVAGHFSEDWPVHRKYNRLIQYDQKLITNSLEKAGFKNIKGEIRDPREEEERLRGYKYIFITADNK